MVGCTLGAGQSAAKPLAAWLTTRSVVEVKLPNRFRNIATVSCSPNTSSQTEIIGADRSWQEFWCTGVTKGGASYRLLFEQTGQCASCWTIAQLSGIDPASLGSSSGVEPGPAATVTPEAVFTATSSGMLFLTSRCKSGVYTGSGFLVGPRTMVTALHVLQDPDGTSCSVTAKQQGTNRTTDVTYYEAWAPLDLAVADLSSPVTGFYFKIAQSSPAAGAGVIALGYSLGNPLSLNQGTVTGAATVKGVPYLLLNLLEAKGSSGGPILNSSGQVIGLTQRGDTTSAQSKIVSINLPDFAQSKDGLCQGAAKEGENTLCGTASPGAITTTGGAASNQGSTPPPAVWPPSGYTRWSGSIAFKWLSGHSCAAKFGCWEIEVETTQGCSTGLNVDMAELVGTSETGIALGSVQRSVAPLTPIPVEIDADQEAITSGKIKGIECFS